MRHIITVLGRHLAERSLITGGLLSHFCTCAQISAYTIVEEEIGGTTRNIHRMSIDVTLLPKRRVGDKEHRQVLLTARLHEPIAIAIEQPEGFLIKEGRRHDAHVAQPAATIIGQYLLAYIIVSKETATIRKDHTPHNGHHMECITLAIGQRRIEVHPFESPHIPGKFQSIETFAHVGCPDDTLVVYFYLSDRSTEAFHRPTIAPFVAIA